ncbi:hypothetical protein F5B22DRAFT_602677 [Xylaria bambusicola]|uniref:uncharacterized protein n=1 Tax=Xylaria bambusicola TaxID=326684 RepID=UPI0020077A69|nr:uncharacterized protein F5B22DRAFT_602677 [Xylaria bambusicola]KAI0517839.1 hypothetical protein F5B22DRAFT_602677 [Xylaria bambusicola]
MSHIVTLLLPYYSYFLCLHGVHTLRCIYSLLYSCLAINNITGMVGLSFSFEGIIRSQEARKALEDRVLLANKYLGR